jgi:hypothetical protein
MKTGGMIRGQNVWKKRGAQSQEIVSDGFVGGVCGRATSSR